MILVFTEAKQRQVSIMNAPSILPDEAPAMRMPRVRFSVRRMMVAVAVIGGILGTCIIPGSKDVNRTMRRRQLSDRTRIALEPLRSRCPITVGRATWNDQVDWLQMACSTTGMKEDERERLVLELEGRLRGPVGPETPFWIWRRLARCGANAKRYVG